MGNEERYDVVIVGAGLAGLSLCRQLLLRGVDKKLLLLDNRADLPGPKQKVGESLVQVAGYYFTRVLDLEEHLLQEHYPKYNLRFHWKTPGRTCEDLQDYSCSYIGKISNVATYQVNRNKIEAHLLDLCLKSANVALHAPVTALDIELSEKGYHQVRYRLDGMPRQIQAEWLVDTTGRTQLVKRKNELKMDCPIRHGSSWCWVEGLVNIEKLTRSTPQELRIKRDSRKQGLFPMWLATNHFCGEGFWFWIIPLKGMTSLGVVYDTATFPGKRVSTSEKLIEWVCDEFPIFRQDLPARRILDGARLADFAYDCKQTIHSAKWAICGMAGRFSDPLYSPGSDLIALYNILIADCIAESNPDALKEKTQLYEPMMRILYEAYVPSYHISYNTLGDQEVFTLKYAWELAIYFAFYAYPFINGLFADPGFIRIFFRKFAQLGPINRNLQRFLSEFYQWKRGRLQRGVPISNDFLELTPLKLAEATYYKVTSSLPEAEDALEAHLRQLKEFARYIYAYLASVAIGEKKALLNHAFVAGIKLASQPFDPELFRTNYEAHAGSSEIYPWTLDPEAMEQFRVQNCEITVPAETDPCIPSL